MACRGGLGGGCAGGRGGASYLGEELGLTQQLFLERPDVVAVHMRIADHVDKVAALEPGDVREQAGEQRVARNVEGDAEAEVGRALVHLARELACD